MNKIDTNKIKEMTNKKIGFNNYEKEELKIRHTKQEKYTSLILIIFITSILIINVKNKETFNTKNNLIKESSKNDNLKNTNDDAAKYYDYDFCISYIDNKNELNENCYKKNTRFDTIDIILEDNNFKGFNIKGEYNGQSFNDSWTKESE